MTAATPAGVVLYPAVDIRGGKAVRLVQGDFERETVYADEPLSAARRWVEEGATALHVVDLDGALAGEPVAFEHLRTIASELDLPVQYGGGLRTLDHLREALARGARRVVLGTAAFTDEALLARAVSELGARLAIAVDVRGGKVATAGWTSTSELAGTDAIAAMRKKGATTFIYTDVDRDGMLEGLDPADVGRIAEAVGDARFVYSGGIGSIEHLHALRMLGAANLEGVIVGKALYEKRFTVAQAVAALGG